MSTDLHPAVQLFLQTTTPTLMQKLSSTMSSTVFHLGQSASFLIAKLLFLTLQQ
jgi:hypothetical protein